MLHLVFKDPNCNGAIGTDEENDLASARICVGTEALGGHLLPRQPAR
jgi:hypothetical protein